MLRLTKGVALLHFGRAGSTLIATMIAHNKLFYFDGEIYESVRTGALKIPENIQKSPEKLLIQRRKKFFYRDYLVSLKPIPEENLRPSLLNMSYSNFLKALNDANINKCIIIKRKNYLRQVLSNKLASKWNKWHFKKNEDSTKTKININCNSFQFSTFKGELVELFNRFDNYYKEMENETKNPLIISYEDDIEKDSYIAYDKIRSYLNLRIKKPEIILSKSNTFKNEDVIENYDEVIKHLKGTPYEWML